MLYKMFDSQENRASFEPGRFPLFDKLKDLFKDRLSEWMQKVVHFQISNVVVDSFSDVDFGGYRMRSC